MEARERQPGDLILDRYLPNADAEAREHAREVLREWFEVLVQIGMELADADRDSPDPPRRPKMRGRPPGRYK